MLEPGRTETRRGCESFLRPVLTLDSLPEAVRRVIQPLQDAETLRHLYHIPSQQFPLRRQMWGRELSFGWRRTPPRTLLFGPDQITVIEGVDAHHTITIPLADLLVIRLVTVLLYSYMELIWRSGAQAQTIQIEYNSVGARQIEPEMARARAWIAAQISTRAPAPEASIQHFPLKFFNYSRMSLLPNEPIIAGVYEPLIRGGGWLLSGPLAPNRAILLTPQHVIVVSDQHSGTSRPSVNNYRMERWFCPRAPITAIHFEPQDDLTWLTLVWDQAAHTLRLPLLPERAAELRGVVENWG